MSRHTFCLIFVVLLPHWAAKDSCTTLTHPLHMYVLPLFRPPPLYCLLVYTST